MRIETGLLREAVESAYMPIEGGERVEATIFEIIVESRQRGSDEAFLQKLNGSICMTCPLGPKCSQSLASGSGEFKNHRFRIEILGIQRARFESHIKHEANCIK